MKITMLKKIVLFLCFGAFCWNAYFDLLQETKNTLVLFKKYYGLSDGQKRAVLFGDAWLIIDKISRIIPGDSKILLHTDYDCGAYCYLSGWAYVPNQETKGQEVSVQLEKPDGAVAHYPAMPIERPDVGIALKNPLYNASGFSVLIPNKDGFDINFCKMRLMVKNNSGTYKSQLCKLTQTVPGTVAATPEPKNDSQIVKFNVDTMENRGEGIFAYSYLSGWAYVPNQQTKGQEVSVQLEKPDGAVVQYPAMPIERPDVGIALKNPLYNASGFSALFPLMDGFDINLCKMRVVVKNNSGTYKSLLCKLTQTALGTVAATPEPKKDSKAVKFSVDMIENRGEGFSLNYSTYALFPRKAYSYFLDPDFPTGEDTDEVAWEWLKRKQIAWIVLYTSDKIIRVIRIADDKIIEEIRFPG